MSLLTVSTCGFSAVSMLQGYLHLCCLGVKESGTYSVVDLGADFLPCLAALLFGICRAIRELALDLGCGAVRIAWIL